VPERALGRSLSPADLLARLQWQPSGPQTAVELVQRLPRRLIIRVQTGDEQAFGAIAHELCSAIFAINARGVREVIISAALVQSTSSATPVDGLFFVTRLHTTSLARWLSQRGGELGVQLYQPYEPTIAPDQEEHPRGVWLPFQLGLRMDSTLPYLSTLARVVRRTPASEICLVEPDAHGGSIILPIDGRFERLYFYSTFSLQQQAGMVKPVPVVQHPLKAFRVRLDLRLDPDRRQRREQRGLALAEDERRITAHINELQRKVRRVKYLKRLVEKEELLEAPSGRDLAARRPRKSLYLFFERHTGDLGHEPAWPALQEIVLNASLAELRDMRYVFCQFALPNTRTGENDLVAFHVVGGAFPETRADRHLPPGLEYADIIFEQDAAWREVGYNLYTPRMTFLEPPLLPDRRDDIEQPKDSGYTGSLLYPRPRLDSPGPRTGPPPVDPEANDRDPWPGRLDERQMFNDLLAQAIYCPSGTDDSSAAAALLAEFRDSDHLCLIYVDPVNKARVPLLLRREDWKPLAEVAPAQLNQVGLMLTRSPADLVQQIERQVADVFHDRSVSLDSAAEELKHRLSAVLAESLGRREQELNAEREGFESDLDRKTLAQALDLDNLRSEWEQTKAQLNQAEVTLRGVPYERRFGRVGGKIGAARNLIEQLNQRAREIERIATDAGQNWVTFVERIMEVTTQLEEDAAKYLEEASRIIHAADDQLRRKHHNVIQTLRPQLNELHQNLRDVGVRFGQQTEDLARTLNLVVQVRAVMEAAGETRALPADGSAAAQAELVATRHEIERLRQLLRDRDNEATHQEREVAKEMTALRQQAAEAATLKEQQKRADEETNRREAQLRGQLRTLDEDLRRQRDQLQQVQTQFAASQAELGQWQNEAARVAATAEEQIVTLRNDLSKAWQQIAEAKEDVERIELAAHNLERESVRKRFTQLTEIIDTLHIAGATSPQIAEGIMQIHAQFITLLLREYSGLAIIPITLYQTIFNERLGHYAVSFVERDDLPDRVIVQVLGDGYTFNGRVIRETKVVVNRKPQEAAD
jgi:molecular chaperone GrpE (heat shock protein)